MSFPTDASALRRDDRRNRIPPSLTRSQGDADSSAWLRRAAGDAQVGLMTIAGLLVGLFTAGASVATMVLAATVAAVAGAVSRGGPVSAACYALGAGLPLALTLALPPSRWLLAVVLATLATLALLGAVGRRIDEARHLLPAMHAILRGALAIAAASAVGAWIGGTA